MADLYTGPGAAFSDAFNAFYAQREAQRQKALLDSITAAREQDERARIQMENQRLNQETEDKRMSDLSKRLENMMPGDIVEGPLLQDVQKYFPERLTKGSSGGFSYVGDVKQRTDLANKKQIDEFLTDLPNQINTLNDVPEGDPRRIALALKYERLTGKNAPASILQSRNATRPTREVVGRDGKPVLVYTDTGEPVMSGGAPVRLYHQPTAGNQPIMPFFMDAQGIHQGSPTGPLTTGALPPRSRVLTTPGAAQEANQARETQTALGVANQMDAAIDAASKYLGPGEGRFQNFQEMVGAPDPSISALATKIIAMKNTADRALTGSTRASANTKLLAMWDNLLANKVEPQNLHAAIQALRDILNGLPGGDPSKISQTTTGGGQGTSPTKKTKKYNPKTGELE